MPKIHLAIIATALMFATACGGGPTGPKPPPTPQGAARPVAENPPTKNAPKIGTSEFYCMQMTEFTSASVTVAASGIGTTPGNRAVLDAAEALEEAAGVAPTAVKEDIAVVAGAWETAANRVEQLSSLDEEKDAQAYRDLISSAQSSIDDSTASTALVNIGQHSADECGVDPRRSGSVIVTTTIPPAPPAPPNEPSPPTSANNSPPTTEEDTFTGDGVPPD